ATYRNCPSGLTTKPDGESPTLILFLIDNEAVSTIKILSSYQSAT
ncbi:uncharacterized protein METZ01_LOCUS428807, partial [marine metagenome]